MNKPNRIPVHVPGQEGAHHCEVGEHDTVETLAILLVKIGKVGDCKFEEIFLFEEDSEEELPRHHRVSPSHGKRLHAHRCRFIEADIVYVDDKKAHKVRPGVTIRKLIEWAVANFPVDKNFTYNLRLGNPKAEPLPLDAHIGSYAECQHCKVTIYLTPGPRIQG